MFHVEHIRGTLPFLRGLTGIDIYPVAYFSDVLASLFYKKSHWATLGLVRVIDCHVCLLSPCDYMETFSTRFLLFTIPIILVLQVSGDVSA
jgi:hypothetical protein